MLVIVPYFNPLKYKSLYRNYNTFGERLLKQGANILTIELTFGDSPPELDDRFGKIAHLNSSSIMWQKEQIINYALKHHMGYETKFAWIDCDVLFKDNSWLQQAEEKLDTTDIIQLFKKVYLLKNNETLYGGSHTLYFQGIVWQYKIHKNWLARRENKELPFSHPGFAWAARKDAFPEGLYNKSITGSGDTLIIDSLLNSWDIHSFKRKFTPEMWEDIIKWKNKLGNLRLDYLPQDIYHLYHGSIKNRSYTTRHNMLADHDYDPNLDVIEKDGVLEWNSDKPNLHNDIKEYFLRRNEDE